MLRISFVLIVMLIAAGCGTAATPAAQSTSQATTPAANTRAYADSVAGFALDYPAGWFVTGPTNDPTNRVTYLTSYDMSKVAGQGGLQEGMAKLDIIATRQPGATLQAALDEAKAGDAKITREERIQLAGNIPAARLTLTDVFGDTAHLLVTVIGEWKIQIAGYGKIPDFDKVFDGIARTVRRG
jgi:hypothetical protein